MKTLTEEFNSITVKAGKEFMIELPINPSTGYIWKTTIISGSLRAKEQTINTQKTIGGDTTVKMLFQTSKNAKDSDAIIMMQYHRPFDNQTKKTQNFNIKII